MSDSHSNLSVTVVIHGGLLIGIATALRIAAEMETFGSGRNVILSET
jgi:hypothetical protein